MRRLANTPSKAASSRAHYEPYGNTAVGTAPTGIGFTGHVNDADTGLVYMQQRFYDPIAGQFMSTDPVTTDADSGKSFNRYEYANSNPYRYVDPDGRDAWYLEPQPATTTAAVPTVLPTQTITFKGPTAPSFSAATGTMIMRGGLGLGLMTYSKPLGAPSEMCGVLSCGMRSEGARADLPTGLTGQNPRESSGKRVNTDSRATRRASSTN